MTALGYDLLIPVSALGTVAIILAVVGAALQDAEMDKKESNIAPAAARVTTQGVLPVTQGKQLTR